MSFQQIEEALHRDDIESLKKLLAETPRRQDGSDDNEWGDLVFECRSSEALSALDNHTEGYYDEWGWDEIIPSVNPKCVARFIYYVSSKKRRVPVNWSSILTSMQESENGVAINKLISLVEEDNERMRKLLESLKRRSQRHEEVRKVVQESENLKMEIARAKYGRK